MAKPSIIRSAACEEYIEIVRAAMRGEKLAFDGKYFTAQNFKMAFKPSGRTPCRFIWPPSVRR